MYFSGCPKVVKIKATIGRRQINIVNIYITRFANIIYNIISNDACAKTNYIARVNINMSHKNREQFKA